MKKQEITELLGHTELSTIISFIAEYAEEDNLFYEKIKKALLPEDGTCDIDYYKTKAEACFDFDTGHHSGRRRYNYDFYEAAYAAASGLDSMLSVADYLVEQEKYADAAAIAMAVAEVIPLNYENVDDSSGSLAGTFDSAIDSLYKIMDNAAVANSIKEEIYHWNKEEVNNSVYSDYGFDEIQTLYEVCCEQLGDTDKVLSDIDRQINEATSEYSKTKDVLRKIHFMQSRNIDAQDVIESHLELNAICKIRFEQLMDAGEYDKALHLAEQGIKIANEQNNPDTVGDWQESILDIYLVQGDVANLLPLAKYLFLHVDNWSRNKEKFYNILKNYTPAAQWQDTMESLLNAAENRCNFDHFTARILHEHQLWKRLFVHCKKGDVSAIEQYEKDLKPYFEREILDLYRDYVERKALIPDWHAYQEVARLLKKMRTYSGGDDLVNQLLEKYRATYKRRKNMIAELKEV